MKLNLDLIYYKRSLKYKFYFFLLSDQNADSKKSWYKRQIVIPKTVRDYIGIKLGDTIIMEIKGKKIIMSSGVNPKEFVESFCTVVKKKLTKKIDLERLIESEIEERASLH